MGSAFRTSDGCNIAKIYLCGFTGTPPRKEIAKTALSAEENIAWEHCDTTISAIKKLRDEVENIQIIGVEKTKNSVCYTDFEYKFPVALVFGNEIMGVSDEALKACDAVAHIPMLGQKESLNIATAYGVIMYEVLRQYSML